VAAVRHRCGERRPGRTAPTPTSNSDLTRIKQASLRRRLDSDAEASLLRRMGYVVSRRPQPRLEELLERLGSRLVPLNRRRPWEGHQYADCPLCGMVAALWLEPKHESVVFVCGCIPGPIDAMTLVAVLAHRLRQ
jgi:hypothetical protein